MGAKKIAALAYGISASSTAAAENLQKFAVPEGGPRGRLHEHHRRLRHAPTSDPLVLGIKNSGADAVVPAAGGGSNIAVVQGLAQNGVKMKSTVLATGYGQDLLDQPVVDDLRARGHHGHRYAPVELKTKATKQFQADLKKYAGYTGVPDYGIYTGYITCDMAIRAWRRRARPHPRGLRAQAAQARRPTTRRGSVPARTDVSAETYGKHPQTGLRYGTCRSRTASSSSSTRASR